MPSLIAMECTTGVLEVVIRNLVGDVYTRGYEIVIIVWSRKLGEEREHQRQRFKMDSSRLGAEMGLQRRER